MYTRAAERSQVYLVNFCPSIFGKWVCTYLFAHGVRDVCLPGLNTSVFSTAMSTEADSGRGRVVII